MTPRGQTQLAQIAHWQDDLAALQMHIGPRFGRPEVRERAGRYLAGLLGSVERRNGWQLAEAVGESSLNRVQRLLGAARWNAETVRGDPRSYVVEDLGDPEAVPVIDETGLLKKGAQSVGAPRQYCGTAGRIENRQIGVFLAYAGPRGRSFLDRVLYLPKRWATDPARRKQAGRRRRAALVRLATAPPSRGPPQPRQTSSHPLGSGSAGVVLGAQPVAENGGCAEAAGAPTAASGKVEPVVDDPTIAFLCEDADIASALFARADGRHAAVTKHPHIREGHERNRLIRSRCDRCCREVIEQSILGHAEGNVDDKLAADHVVAEEREHPRLISGAEAGKVLAPDGGDRGNGLFVCRDAFRRGGGRGAGDQRVGDGRCRGFPEERAQLGLRPWFDRAFFKS